MTMKKINSTMLVLVAVMLAGGVLSGCKAPGRTKEEVSRRHHEAIQQNFWQLQDDIDAVFLLDRSTRLSESMVR